MAAQAAAFSAGFTATVGLLCMLAGAVCALLLAGMALLLVVLVLQVAFDRGTDALAAVWRRKGKAPRWRWAQVIMAGTQKGGGEDGPGNQKAPDEIH